MIKSFHTKKSFLEWNNVSDVCRIFSYHSVESVCEIDAATPCLGNKHLQVICFVLFCFASFHFISFHFILFYFISSFQYQNTSRVLACCFVIFLISQIIIEINDEWVADGNASLRFLSAPVQIIESGWNIFMFCQSF